MKGRRSWKKVITDVWEQGHSGVSSPCSRGLDKRFLSFINICFFSGSSANLTDLLWPLTLTLTQNEIRTHITKPNVDSIMYFKLLKYNITFFSTHSYILVSVSRYQPQYRVAFTMHFVAYKFSRPTSRFHCLHFWHHVQILYLLHEVLLRWSGS